MTHRMHPSWKKAKPKKAARRRTEDPMSRLAEGLHRPPPSLKPPMTYDEHYDAKMAQIKAPQEEESGD